MPATILNIWDTELAYNHTTLAEQVQARPAQPVRPDGAEPLWGVYLVNPADGGHGIHMFPHSTFEWRAAEYGIDPDDLETLLDVILHEPYIPDPSDSLAWDDPAAATVLKATRGLPTCWTPGVSDADRLAAHLERIRHVKQHAVGLKTIARADRQGALDFVGARRVAPADPLDPIRTQTRLDPVRVASRKLAVDWQRSSDHGGSLAFQAKPPATFVSPVKAAQQEGWAA
ncbi:hypothetical protein [Spongiactinospora sp. TRM90649]|uniref:hypothetical protein n=1 Tax=Spongiactinospora sp. TRM90649 TaxID=3031114 RepID=UPI0023F7F6A0|nr:hypothetical protein [Spongiactinospora sp. TRM90649]MDF5756670.1 hypothetical protein [Spongiactinospora sp. TRM90649]